MSQILYKYRSLENWKYVLDIFLNKRLYAASFYEMNDPMEGRYRYSKEVPRQFRVEIRNNKKLLRICSLSSSARELLLWSYYASGHTGIAVGVSMREGQNIQLRPVGYHNHFYVGDVSRTAEETALAVLTRKLDAWKHEKEVRAFTEADEFIPVKIRRVYLGHAIETADEQLVRELVRSTTTGVRVLKVKLGQLIQQLDQQ